MWVTNKFNLSLQVKFLETAHGPWLFLRAPLLALQLGRTDVILYSGVWYMGGWHAGSTCSETWLPPVFPEGDTRLPSLLQMVCTRRQRTCYFYSREMSCSVIFGDWHVNCFCFHTFCAYYGLACSPGLIVLLWSRQLLFISLSCDYMYVFSLLKQKFLQKTGSSSPSVASGWRWAGQ